MSTWLVSCFSWFCILFHCVQKLHAFGWDNCLSWLRWPLRGYRCLKRFYKKGDATQWKAEVEPQMKQERWNHGHLYRKGTFLSSPHKGILGVWILQLWPSFRDKLHPLLVKSVTTHLQNWYLVYTGAVAACATVSLLAPFKTGFG